MIPKWLQNKLKPSDLATVAKALKAAETGTSGEIVPMIVRRSAANSHVPVLIFCASFICFLLFDRFLGVHLHWPNFVIPLGGLLVSAVTANLFGSCSLMLRLLSDDKDLDHQVAMRAEVEFFEAGLDKTAGATGILLFLSLAEHRVVVLADKGIASKLPDTTWSEVVAILVKGMKSDQLVQALQDAIALCGKLLAPEFPIRAGDKNELRDKLIIKD